MFVAMNMVRRELLFPTALQNMCWTAAGQNLSICFTTQQGTTFRSLRPMKVAVFMREAEEAGSEIVLVEPAHTTQKCSNCGLVQKKTLAERWHDCICGASMHRDLNAAVNILNRATLGTRGSHACLRRSLCMQASSMKQEANGVSH